MHLSTAQPVPMRAHSVAVRPVSSDYVVADGKLLVEYSNGAFVAYKWLPDVGPRGLKWMTPEAILAEVHACNALWASAGLPLPTRRNAVQQLSTREYLSRL